MTVTILTAGFIGLIMSITAIQCGRMRTKTKTSLGEGDDIHLLGAIRAHGNLTEYAPIVIMLIGACEYMQMNSLFVAGMGIVFVVARAFHAYGLIKLPDAKNNIPRAIGAMGTFIVLVAGSVSAILGGYGIL